MPKFGEALFGKSGKAKKLSTLDKNQQELEDLIQQGLTSGEGPLADLFGSFNEEEFEKGVTQPALKNFKENILPQILEKFTANNQSLGTPSQIAQLKAGTDLQSELSKLLYQAKQQQKQNRLSGINTSLGKQTVENIYKPGSEGLVQGAVKGFAEGAGKGTAAAIAG
jgi:hypothetical protein